MKPAGNDAAGFRGKVLYRTKGYYYVKNAQGEISECKLKRSLFLRADEKPDPVPGDYVLCRQRNLNDHPLIYEITERRSVLQRQKPTRNETLTMAANIDVLAVTVPLNSPPFSLELTVKLLTEANRSNIAPAVVLTKADLVSAEAAEKSRQEMAVLCPDVFVTGFGDDAGIRAVKAHLHNRVAVLAGLSGAGKSSLMNMMFEDYDLKVGAMNEKYNLGRHTTTMSRLYEPEPGFEIIDSPGIRNFEFCRASPAELTVFFPVIGSFTGRCKMRNCFHLDETVCAVKSALAQGNLQHDIYDLYVSIQARSKRT